jgi:hypothetical protein
VYIASASGAVGAGVVTAVQTAIEAWAAPLCITPTVASASNKSIAVTYTAKVYDNLSVSEADLKTAISTALSEMLALREIGGDDSAIAHSLIVSTIQNTYPAYIFSVVVSAPAGDTAFSASEVPVIGAVTATITWEAAP